MNNSSKILRRRAKVAPIRQSPCGDSNIRKIEAIQNKQLTQWPLRELLRQKPKNQIK